jgi:D-amino-acid dehydrogenase
MARMSRTKTIVVGAGLLGITTAYELAARGEAVELLEAREGVALETSYANGAMLTPSLVEPWNAPGVHKHLVASFFDPHAALKLRASAIPSLLSWGIRFLYYSSPSRHRAATHANYALATYSMGITRELREALNLTYESSNFGTLKVFRDRAAMDGPIALARRLAERGLRYEVLDREQMIKLEPQLAPVREQIVGGLYFPDDEGGDAHLFCRALAGKFMAAGGRLRTNVAVEKLVTRDSRVVGLKTAQETMESSRIVVAAGNGTVRLLQPLGINLPIRPAKGYSVTIDAPSDPMHRPRIAAIDDAMHAAVVPLGSHLRVVGTAEFAGHDRTLRAERVDNLFNLLEALYPRISAGIDRNKARAWTGSRPMSADGLPFIGATRVRGLYVNAGHGHLGWTLAAGSARLLTDLILGVSTTIDPAPYRATR